MNDADRRQTSDGFDHDAMFADIVAHWNDAAPEPGPRPSADEPLVDHHHFDVDPPQTLPTPAQPQAIPAPQAWRAHEVDPEYEEHFEPPPIAPLPVGDLQFWAIIAGMCGGPLLLLYLVLFNREAGSGWML